MRGRHVIFGWLGVLAVWLTLASVPGYGQRLTRGLWRGTRADSAPKAMSLPFALPVEALPEGVRERVLGVLEQPTLSTHGPVEAFICQPSTYYWLLDHPDQTVKLWRGLGAKCTDIEDCGGGQFRWHDDQGSEVHWNTVLRGERQRIWFAEGKVRPGPLLPAAPVRAVVVLTHAEGNDPKGRPAVRHQMHLILHTDSKAMALAARLMGASAIHLGEQYVAQMEMFFGAMAWYLHEHPERVGRLLGAVPVAPEKETKTGE